MEQQTITCSNCLTINPSKNLYCQSCGKPLLASASAVISPPPAPGEMPMPYPPQPPMGAGFPGQGAPQQAPAGFYAQPMPPPPPPPAPPAPPPAPRLPTLKDLGVKVESWTEVYEGAADKLKAVEDAFVQEMIAHSIPQTQLAPIEYATGSGRRLFHTIQARAGAVITRISPIGKDLGLSWTLYARQKPNWKMIGILIGVVFGISLFNSLIYAVDFGRFLLQFLFGSFGWVLPVVVAALVAGKIMKGDIWALFVEGADDFEEADLEVMAIVVQNAIDAALEKAKVETGEGCCCKE